MPQIPVYKTKNMIQPRTPEPLRDEASQDFETNRIVIDALQKTGETWQKAHDTMQYAKAKAGYAKELNEIDNEAAIDVNRANEQTYQEKRAEAKSRYLQGIDNKQLAEQLSFEFDVDKSLSDAKTKMLYREREIEEGKLNLSDLLNDAQIKINYASAADKQYYMDKRDEIINQHINAGIVTPKEADTLKKNSAKLAVQYDIYNDNSKEESQSGVLAELRKKDGKYSYVDEKDRLELIQDSQRRIYQNNQTFKREVDLAQDERLQSIYKKINKGTITLADFKAEEQVPESEGGLPPKLLKDLYDGYSTRIKDALQIVVDSDEKAVEYLSYIDRFIREPDKLKARELLAMAYKDNELSTNEAVVLDRLKAQILSMEENQKMAAIKPWNMMKSNVRALKEYFTGVKSATNSDIAVSIKQLLSEIEDNKDIEKVAERIMYEDKLKRNPAIAGLVAGAPGVPFMDINGIVKRVKKDGSTEDMK